MKSQPSVRPGWCAVGDSQLSFKPFPLTPFPRLLRGHYRLTTPHLNDIRCGVWDMDTNHKNTRARGDTVLYS